VAALVICREGDFYEKNVVCRSDGNGSSD